MTDHSPSDELVTADLKEVQAWGWSGVELADRIFQLRRDTIPGLPADAFADASAFAPIYTEHPATWRILVTPERQIVGCWHFLSLPREKFRASLGGTLSVRDVSPQLLRPIHEAGWYDIYVLTYILGTAFRLSESSLRFARDMFDVLEDLARRQIFIDGLAANFVTVQGRGIGRALGMKELGDHRIFGSIYFKRLPDMLRDLKFADRRGSFVGRLKELYPADVPEADFGV